MFCVSLRIHALSVSVKRMSETKREAKKKWSSGDTKLREKKMLSERLSKGHAQ